MKTNLIMIVLATGLLAAGVASASDYTVDPSHSNVNFTTRHLISKVEGRFKDFDGTFTFDEKHPESLVAELTVKTASVSTDNEKRDGHLKSGDFFDVEKFPTMTFKSTKATPAGKGHMKLAGDLTIHGVTKPVVFAVEYLGEAKDPWGGTRAAFTASTKINRKDFGISWNKTLDNGGVLVKDEVAVDLNIEGTANKPAKMHENK